MICIQCGAVNPDHTRFCSNCGRPQTSLVASIQFKETLAPLTLSGQQPFTEQPTLRQPFDGPEPGSKSLLSQNQLWEAFGTGEISPVQQLLPDHETHLEVPETPAPELSMAAASEVTTVPLPATRTTWSRVLEPRFAVLARRLPAWMGITGIAVTPLALAGLQLTGSDWAVGAMHTAIAAGIVALLIALATGVRTLAGMRRGRSFIYAGLTFFLLLTLSIAGISQQALIHRVQGQSLEGQLQWTRAIAEFQLAGEHAPTSDDIARTYVEWGERLSATQDYLNATGKFGIVLTDYGSATSQVRRAQSDEIAAYLAWGKQAMQQHNYSIATTLFDGLLSLSFCSYTCQEQGSTLDATAYYNVAESQLAAQQYDSAVSTFQVVLARFPNSPEAQQLHPDLAQAILGQGKEQLASDCSSAIPTYQQLVTDYADTPAGQEAAKALQAPQPVTGQFVGSIPHDSSLSLVVFLAQNLNGAMATDQFNQALNRALKTTIHGDGTFSFNSVPQGTYDLAWGSARSDGSYSFSFTYNSPDNTPVYVATVGPLCSFDFGDISQDIPTP